MAKIGIFWIISTQYCISLHSHYPFSATGPKKNSPNGKSPFFHGFLRQGAAQHGCSLKLHFDILEFLYSGLVIFGRRYNLRPVGCVPHFETIIFKILTGFCLISNFDKQTNYGIRYIFCSA